MRDIGHRHDVRHSEHNTKQEPRDEHLGGLRVHRAGEPRIIPIQDPQQPPEAVTDSGQPDAAGEQREFGQGGSQRQQDNDGGEPEMAVNAFDYCAERPEPI